MRDISLSELRALYGRLDKPHQGGEFFESLVRAIYQNGDVLTSADYAVDCGANTGQHTFDISKKCKRVVAFEPIPALAKRLVERIKIAGYLETITLLELAVSDSPGLKEFKVDSEASALSSFIPQLGERPTNTIEVVTVTLDSIIHFPIRFMKLDIEGAEFNALVGAERILSEHRPVVVFEFGRKITADRFEFTLDDFLSYFENIDYALFDIFGTRFRPEFWSNETWMPWYFIALPAERDSEGVFRAIGEKTRSIF